MTLLDTASGTHPRLTPVSEEITTPTSTLMNWQNMMIKPSQVWAPYQIRKIVDFACAGNAGSALPLSPTDPHAPPSTPTQQPHSQPIHPRQARTVMHAGIAN